MDKLSGHKMVCRILGEEDGDCCFYCSTTMMAFGPVSTKEELERVREWLGKDPREVGDIMGEWNKFPEEEDESSK